MDSRWYVNIVYLPMGDRIHQYLGLISTARTNWSSDDWFARLRDFITQGEDVIKTVKNKGHRKLIGSLRNNDTIIDLCNDFRSSKEADENTIADQRKIIAERDQTIADQKQTIAERDETIAAQNQTINAKDSTIAQLETQLAALGIGAKDQTAPRKSKRKAEAAKLDGTETGKATTTATNKKSRSNISDLKRSNSDLTLSTETYYFSRKAFESVIESHACAYLEDTNVTINNPRISMTKFSAAVRSASSYAVEEHMECLILTSQDRNAAGPGFYEADSYMFNDYLSQQKNKAALGGEPGVDSDGKLGMKVLFFNKGERDMVRQGFQRAMPTKHSATNEGFIWP